MKKGKIFIIITVIAGLTLGISYYIKNGGVETIKSSNQYLAFIPNVGDGTVSVINVQNQELIDNIKIGKEVSHGIATTPDGSKLYTGDLDEGKLFVYDAKNNRLTKMIDTGKRIHGIDITPDGKYVLLASGETEIDDKYNYIQIIDTNTDEIVQTITSDGKSPAHIDFTKDGKLAFVSNVMSNDVSIIDIDKREIVDNVKVGIMPNETEPSPDDKFLYVANVQEGSISIVDIGKRKEIGKIKVSPGTHGVAVTNDGKYIWTTNRFGKNIAIIDIHDKRVIKTIDVDGEPNHVSILPNGDYAYVTNLESNNLMIIDTITFEIVKEIEIGVEPHEIDFVKL
ncbi:cytochrome D1 domain-containing protein [Wukongibacter baidiensis]|uniref:YncE family protein n=1 Tax=Wukongibacter baidiensis TaxID=1723361 RepID=UPI003D7FD4CD